MLCHGAFSYPTWHANNCVMATPLSAVPICVHALRVHEPASIQQYHVGAAELLPRGCQPCCISLPALLCPAVNSPPRGDSSASRTCRLLGRAGRCSNMFMVRMSRFGRFRSLKVAACLLFVAGRRTQKPSTMQMVRMHMRCASTSQRQQQPRASAGAAARAAQTSSGEARQQQTAAAVQQRRRFLQQRQAADPMAGCACAMVDWVCVV